MREATHKIEVFHGLRKDTATERSFEWLSSCNNFLGSDQVIHTPETFVNLVNMLDTSWPFPQIVLVENTVLVLTATTIYKFVNAETALQVLLTNLPAAGRWAWVTSGPFLYLTNGSCKVVYNQQDSSTIVITDVEYAKALTAELFNGQFFCGGVLLDYLAEIPACLRVNDTHEHNFEIPDYPLDHVENDYEYTPLPGHAYNKIACGSIDFTNSTALVVGHSDAHLIQKPNPTTSHITVIGSGFYYGTLATDGEKLLICSAYCPTSIHEMLETFVEDWPLDGTSFQEIIDSDCPLTFPLIPIDKEAYYILDANKYLYDNADDPAVNYLTRLIPDGMDASTEVDIKKIIRIHSANNSLMLLNDGTLYVRSHIGTCIYLAVPISNTTIDGFTPVVGLRFKDIYSSYVYRPTIVESSHVTHYITTEGYLCCCILDLTELHWRYCAGISVDYADEDLNYLNDRLIQVPCGHGWKSFIDAGIIYKNNFDWNPSPVFYNLKKGSQDAFGNFLVGALKENGELYVWGSEELPVPTSTYSYLPFLWDYFAAISETIFFGVTKTGYGIIIANDEISLMTQASIESFGANEAMQALNTDGVYYLGLCNYDDYEFFTHQDEHILFITKKETN